MILWSWLTPVVGARFAKPVFFVGLALLLLTSFGVWLHFHDRKVVQQETAKTAEQARTADAKAADSRVVTTQVIANDTQELKNAVAPLPDRPLTDRQRARYCATLLRQQGQSAGLPAICRSDAKPGANASGGR